MMDFSPSSVGAATPPTAHSELGARAAALFSVCDQEEKGFVTKRDMQRMRSRLPELSPDQLEEAFDRLDRDGNGYLTLEEFAEGFGEYLGVEAGGGSGDARELGMEEEPKFTNDARVEEERLNPDLSSELSEEDEFNLMLSELGILGLVEDDSALREMWTELRGGADGGGEVDPELAARFEKFLTGLSLDLRRRTTEHERLEDAVRARTQQQERQMERLYEEMESQMGAERRQRRQEEERREQRARQEWQAAMALKEQQVAEALAKVQEMEKQLEAAKKSLPDMREENAHLAKERDQLQQELDRQRVLQRDLQSHVDEMRSKTAEERRQRARAALRVSENIAQEREGIVKQLDILKAVNSKMLDERDVATAKAMRGDGLFEGRTEPSLAEDMAGIWEEGQDMGNDDVVVDLGRLMPKSQKINGNNSLGPPVGLDNGGSEYECDDDYFDGGTVIKDDDVNESMTTTPVAAPPRALPRPSRHLPGRETARLQSHLSRDSNVSLRDELACLGETTDGTVDEEEEEEDEEEYGDDEEEDSLGNGGKIRRKGDGKKTRRNKKAAIQRRVQAKEQQHQMSEPGTKTLASATLSNASFGTDLSSVGESDLASFNAQLAVLPPSAHYIPPLSQAAPSSVSTTTSSVVLRSPERVFKLIFIGDSCVGKTSLVTRFCRDSFEPDVRSTVGVDFHTRAVLLGDQSVCLQCWDTAGQERYRAITRQYFRKVDAVVVVYDVTSEKSYLNAREWLQSAADAVNADAGDDDAASAAPMLLVGNKLDLADDDLQRRVRKCEGLEMARRFAALFWEVSAADGRNVEAALVDLAHRLRETEDRSIRNAAALKLSEGQGKKKSCCGGDKKEAKK